MIKSAQLTGPPQKSALQVAAASGHVSVMEVSEYRTSMVTMILMRQVLVRKGKANCVVTDDWGWNLLHEVRMKKNHGFDNEYNQDYGVNVEDNGEDRDPHAHDGDQAGAADCLGAIQLVERECRGLVNTRDHLGRLEPLSVKLYDDGDDVVDDDDDDGADVDQDTFAALPLAQRWRANHSPASVSGRRPRSQRYGQLLLCIHIHVIVIIVKIMIS